MTWPCATWCLTNRTRKNLRAYLGGGGFLHADDNYGMDPYIRPQLEKIFPGSKLVELPFSHPIFHQKFDSLNGTAQNSRTQWQWAGPIPFGLFHEGRLVALYTYECDLGDGWEDQNVHKDPNETRTKALKMGANILRYVFAN